MIVTTRFSAIAILLALATSSALGQEDQLAVTSVADDAAVWAVIERSWQAEQQGDTRWIDELLSADFVGWDTTSPAPRDKGSTRRWQAFSARQVDVLEYELYPLSIVVHGDMAVAHYLFSSATKPKSQRVEMTDGRYTDVLVRVGNEWRFISWHGGSNNATQR